MLFGSASRRRGCQHRVDAGTHGGLRCCSRYLDANGQVRVVAQRHWLSVPIHLHFDHVGYSTSQIRSAQS